MFRARVRSALCAALVAAGVALAAPAVAGTADAGSVESPTSDDPADDDCDPLFDDACDEKSSSLVQFPDPWEGYNRAVLVFNGGLDRFVLNPITFV